jgi:Domain of unknown function (DUF4422)
MTAKIFTCHHLVPEYVFPPNRLFGMLISGTHSDPVAGYLGDLDGENIAGENIYSELRHQFFVWRNVLSKYDYVGFEHYRRVFFFDPASSAAARGGDLRRWRWRTHFHSVQNAAYAEASDDDLKDYMTYRAGLGAGECRVLEDWISQHDIIVQRSFMHDGLEQQWKSCLPADVWDITLDAVRDAFRAVGSGCDLGAGVQTGFFNNMYIMRSDLFDQYMHFYMHAAHQILRRAQPFQRMLGHCGERIFSMWLYQRRIDDPMLRVQQHPFLYCLDTVAPNLPGNFGPGMSVTSSPPPVNRRRRKGA